MELADIREQIDRIDKDITDLLQQRAKLAIQAGILKKTMNRPIRDIVRERAVLAGLNDSKGPLSKIALRSIFNMIIQEMVTLEEDDTP